LKRGPSLWIKKSPGQFFLSQNANIVACTTNHGVVSMSLFRGCLLAPTHEAGYRWISEATTMRLGACTTAVLLSLTLPTLSSAADELDLATQFVRGAAAERVDRYLSWSEQFGFSGVALLALDGEIVLHKPYGLADRKQKLPNRLNTVFCFGSIAKQFTAAAVMKLEQQGKLRTEDPISKYIGDVPPDKSGITIHQLLTHTAGLIDHHGISDFQKMDRDTAVSTILSKPLEFRPGKEFYYSNSGYTLAAAIVERVSGRNFVDFMQAEIFKPAGMTETGFMGNDLWDEPRVAHIYRGRRDNGTPSQKPGPYWVLLGNGGVVSTVGQMYLWDRALRGEGILSAAAKRKIFTPYNNDYGYGWDVVKTDRGTTRYAHDGGSSLGLSAHFARFVEEDGAFILASNATIGDSLATDLVVRPLLQLIFEPTAEELPEVPALVSRDDQSERYTGQYKLAGGGRFVVYNDGGQLFLAAAGQDALAALDARAKPFGKQADGLNALAARVVEGVFAGDLQPLEAAFTRTGEPAPARAARWSRLLVSSRANRGKFVRAEVLGTTNLASAAPPNLVTWIRLYFTGGQRVCRFHWNGEKLAGLGGDAWPYPYYAPLRFTPEGEAVAFHFGSGREVRARFEPADGDAVALVIGGATGRRQMSN
jgi:CubicO group peptidase (beta-lactamase class C family)